MIIYVVLHNSCTYESAAAPIGYFKTAALAYKCMRTAILKEYNRRREEVFEFGYMGYWKGKKYLDGQWWGIDKVEVAG